MTSSFTLKFARNIIRTLQRSYNDYENTNCFSRRKNADFISLQYNSLDTTYPMKESP